MLLRELFELRPERFPRRPCATYFSQSSPLRPRCTRPCGATCEILLVSWEGPDAFADFLGYLSVGVFLFVTIAYINNRRLAPPET
jgi:hypothetical protein